jgi:hypothetical protein
MKNCPKPGMKKCGGQGGMKKAQRRNEMPLRGMKNARVRNEIPPKGNEKCAGQGMKNIESRNEKMWR